MFDGPAHGLHILFFLLRRALGAGGQLGGGQEEAVERAHVGRIQGHRLAVVGLGQLHVLEPALGVPNLSVSIGDN